MTNSHWGSSWLASPESQNPRTQPRDPNPQNSIPRSTSRQGKDGKWWRSFCTVVCSLPAAEDSYSSFSFFFSPLPPSKIVCLWTFQKEQNHRSSLGSSCKSAGECKFSHSLNVNPAGKRQFGVSSTIYEELTHLVNLILKFWAPHWSTSKHIRIFPVRMSNWGAELFSIVWSVAARR